MEGGGDTTGDKAKKRLKRTQRMEKRKESRAQCLKSKGKGKGKGNEKNKGKQQMSNSLQCYLASFKFKNLPLSKEPKDPPAMLSEEFIICSNLALDHYNKKKGTDYTLVKVLMGNEIDDYGFIFYLTWKRAHWFHINFQAKRKNAGHDCENISFFAELHKWKDGFAVTTCEILENSFSVGCGHCPSERGKINICRPNAFFDDGICHPHGFRVGRWPYQLPLT